MSGILDTLARLFSSVAFWVMVQPWEQAIRVRAGRHVRRLAPGFHLRIPILDEVHKQTARLRNAIIPTQTLSTTCGATLVVGATIGYAIGDVEKLYRSLHHAEDTITQLAASAIAGVVFSMQRSEARPEIVGERVTASLRTAFEPFGLGEVHVRLTDFAFVRAFRLVNDYRFQIGKPLEVSGDRA